MAEAIGVAGSIAGLVTIAEIVLRKGYQYVKGVREAEESVHKLVAELSLLFGVLHQLKIYAEQLEQNGEGIDPSIQTTNIQACYETMNKVEKQFDKCMPNLPMSTSSKMIWPLKKKTKELLVEIERHKTTMMLAMKAKEMYLAFRISDCLGCSY